MVLRKINAGLSLLTTLLILDHTVFMSVWMLSAGTIQQSASKMPRILTVLVVIHAVLSIILVFRSRKGAAGQGYKAYPRENWKTYLQRITAVVMLLLLALHIIGAIRGLQPKLLHGILHPVFFAAVLGHTAVSAGKALITLGIGNARVIRIVDVVMGILCAGIFLASVAGLYMGLSSGAAV